MTVQTAPRIQTRDPSFSQQEAESILRAAWNHRRGQELPQTYAAKRWVPWLMAYTGARVGEIAQLRRQDVQHVDVDGQPDGVWVLTLTPEAGRIKTKKAREVPLHPHLVEQGFIEFVESATDERLFLVPDAKGEIAGPLQGVKNRLAEFTRAIVSDRGVSPNHGWRHRFRTVGQDVGMSEGVLNAICGWKPRDVGARYGSVSLKARTEAISRLPRINLK